MFCVLDVLALPVPPAGDLQTQDQASVSHLVWLFVGFHGC